MPEQLKVLDLFSGIRSADSALGSNALEAFGLSPFVRSSLTAELSCASTGPLSLAMTMCGLSRPSGLHRME